MLLHVSTAQSGLTEACHTSTVSLAEAEQKMVEFVYEHVPTGRCALAGNTVHMDKRFLDKYMPQLTSHLHYRIIDVSSVKELCRYYIPYNGKCWRGLNLAKWPETAFF